MSRPKITEKALLDDLRETAEQVDGGLTINEYNDKGNYPPQTVIRRFDGWNNAKEKADIEVNKPISDKQLLDDLKHVAKTVDGSLTLKEYKKHGNHSPKTFHDRFGSWNKAKKEAGLRVTEAGHTTDYRKHREYRVEALSHALRQLDYALTETKFSSERGKRHPERTLRQARNRIEKVLAEDRRRLDDNGGDGL